ncbi:MULTISPECIES: CueP family metal-binding protein [Aestuariimicrobium]|uniref:CueP family metal-binding protein n=1 Tax=Aestuariimicrobium TaxID=396388 RepID=UPI0003B328A5|nr:MULTISPECIES: CueP family metal-binding protein [Aestuariimicrobium]CAI9402194.1 hypothetical protein AESSP_00750 [Aestuariimicrobium sp. T2.26MG-19.2B]
MITRRQLAIGGLGVGAVVGLGAWARGAADGDDSARVLLEKYGLAQLTPEQVIDTLDADGRARPLPLSGSVRAREVILSDGETRASVALTGDRFYLAVMPFRSRTHECFFHDVGRCSGEYARQAVHLTITDSSGAVLVDEDAVTGANAFVGRWLPRNRTGTVTVTAEGLRGEAAFSSKDDAATCLTTLQLV